MDRTLKPALLSIHKHQKVYELKETGTTAGMKDQMLNFSQLNQLLGIQRYHEMEEKYVLR